jgi:hypothetical protein
MAWRDQYHAVEAANAKAQAIQKQFDALTVPIISGKFVSGSAAPTGEKKENCIVTLVVHIKNLGAPTALENISISITRDAKEFDAQFVPASNVTLFYGSNPAGPAISFGFENHLIKKAAHSPILTNVPIDAWFQILVLGLSRDEFFSKGTTISLSFDQVATGKRMSITHVIKGGPSEFPLDQKKLYQESR